ncbi:hypothetical protein AVEN_30301-1 [Araneus ventricosus]|uniref:Reverse transcriptase domain-containing protein n=1 Tax=Araneus ventricosus TaxID=182803 RepID=A0A4Y2SZZ2_ARAVE|nr:hypothetical protein AVEN_30301-1 [Araneus ventricosus]
MYADDTAILARNKNPNYIQIALNRHLKALEDWFIKWKIEINVSKTEAIMFANARSLFTLLTFRLFSPTALSSDINHTQLSSHSFTLLHSVSSSSLLATARLLTFSELFPVLLRATVEGRSFYEAPMYAPPPCLLTAEMNPIQLIVRYFTPCWTQYSSRMEVAPFSGAGTPEFVKNCQELRISLDWRFYYKNTTGTIIL